ncbi:Chaperone protein dnaJ [Coemansia brasiliensis]|uniref:Chaperone protein dnaJ n=1 Tax=Coemansia brasiliensis TaxID=2650707 RepID=A0A9W8I6J7_9FUNG|nr:Chaperone protein dnaJ [Coemansia brasiliensis]
MEVNRDEAERALAIARRKWQNGDHSGGLRLARKSHSLYPTERSKQLIEEYSKADTATEKPPDNKNSTATPEKEGIRSRKNTTKESDTQRTYTAEQAAAVKRVMAIKHDYYKVLNVERTATDAEIKKAYRKSALAFHPDKNTAPGADEAFKLVAHAFTILSDQSKRQHYDRFGADERSSATAQRQSPHFNGMYGGARPYADEISPEDLFNMFFGGDFGQFNVQFGPNIGVQRGGMRFQRARPAPATQQNTGLWASCMQILPLVLLILSFFATSIVSLLFGGDAAPSFSFERSARYAVPRTTNARHVPYWVNRNEFAQAALDRSPSQLWNFERDVEAQYISRLQRRCREEREYKRMQMHQAQGWLGFGTDQKLLQAAQAIPTPACDELRRFR